MSWSMGVVTATGLVAALISGAVAVFAWQHRDRRGALPFLGLLLTLSCWSLLYSIQLGFDTLGDQLLFQRVTLGLAGAVPTLWLLFALAYTGQDTWLTRTRVFGLLLEPLAFGALALTNPFHGLVWTDAVMASTAIGPVPSLTLGLGYWAHIFYAYAAVALGIGLLVYFGGTVAPVYRKQVSLLVLAAVPPFLAHIAFTMGVGPIPSLDLTPFVFAFTGLVFGLALFEFELLKLAPMARSESLRQVGDGLLVVDRDGRIADIVGVASEVIEPAPAIGEPVMSVFPDERLDELDGNEFSHPDETRNNIYQCQVSTLTDHHGVHIGAIVILRDITEFRHSETRLSVSNRVLRHNLRNDLLVILGTARQLESELDHDGAEHARKIHEKGEHLLDIAEKTRQLTELSADREQDSHRVDIVEEIRAVLAELRTERPAIDLQLDPSMEPAVASVDPTLFRRALRNALESVIEHNDAREPWVEIGFKHVETVIRVVITDNGTGIPESDRKAIESGIETPLEHSRGVALWLSYWCVRTWGGEFCVAPARNGSNPTVAFTIPRD